MLLTADIGTEHGLSFAVYLRAPFGIRGTRLPAISRGLVAAMWSGIQTYLGALALNGIGSPFLGFDNWFVWYAAFGIVQVVNTASGIMAADHYLIRRRRVNVPDLYSMTGQFRYTAGVNWAGLFSWIVAGGIAA